jgi:hypothetical protein
LRQKRMAFRSSGEATMVAARSNPIDYPGYSRSRWPVARRDSGRRGGCTGRKQRR